MPILTRTTRYALKTDIAQSIVLPVNLQPSSEAFNNASIWTPAGSGGTPTISSNATTSPYGYSTADKLVEVNASSSHTLTGIDIASVAGAPYTISLHVKAAGTTAIGFGWLGVGQGAFMHFNIAAGTIFASSSSGAATNNGSTVTGMPDGWFRISVSGTLTVSLGHIYIALQSPVGTEGYTGNGVNGVYLWGAQLETGTSMNAYVAT